MNKPSELTSIAVVAPSNWASYLVNGDLSGLERDEIKAVGAFEKDIGFSVTHCEEHGFCHDHDAYHLYPYGADCELYFGLVPPDFVAPVSWFLQADNANSNHDVDAD